MSDRKRIVVVGGGFAGLHLIRHLEKRLPRGNADVVVIDRRNYHLFTPLLYQVATGELPPHAIAYPLRVPAASAGYRFVRGEVVSIDLARRVVVTEDGEHPYDHVVIAPGSVTNDYGIAGVKEHAYTVKWLEDGRLLRNRILQTFEAAAIERDAARRRDMLSFVIVGAGPVGVELAASMRDLMDNTLRRLYPSIDVAREPSITVIDGSSRVLPAMDERLSRIALRRLERLGVRVVLGALVAEVFGDSVRTKDGREHVAHTVIWAGGVRPNPIVTSLDVPKSPDGRLIVDDRFRVDGRDDVLALGDSAAFTQDGALLPQLAQVAVLEAPSAAANLARLVAGRPTVPFRYKRKGDLIALGRTSAAAEFASFGHLVVGGFFAWTAWRTNYLMQLLGVRSRATLLLEWLLSYFSRRIVTDIT